MQAKSLNFPICGLSSQLATRRPSDAAWASILALTFILVTRKSPDQKQEVSNQIKSKIQFLFGSQDTGEAQRKLKAGKNENKAPKHRQTAQTP